MAVKMRKRKLWYAWRQAGKYRLSEYPPDMPYRPSIEFNYKREVEEHADKKKADLYWWSQPWTVSLSS
jgi:hypothetical protein